MVLQFAADQVSITRRFRLGFLARDYQMIHKTSSVGYKGSSTEEFGKQAPNKVDIIRALNQLQNMPAFSNISNEPALQNIMQLIHKLLKEFTESGGADLGSLMENKAKWYGKNPQNYSFAFTRSCYCAANYAVSVIITVGGGVIINACFQGSGEPLSDNELANILTINKLFESIQEEMINGHQVEIEYDAETGAPKKIELFNDKQAEDGKVTITIQDIELTLLPNY